jgi:hypothetical protein
MLGEYCGVLSLPLIIVARRGGAILVENKWPWGLNKKGYEKRGQ